MVVADDLRTYAEALGTTLRLERGIDIAAVVHEGNAVDTIRRKSPDVLVVSVDPDDGDRIEIIREIRRSSPDIRVLALADRDEDPSAARAVEAGASGVVSKRRSIKDVATSIRAAHRGDVLAPPPASGRRRRRRQDAGMEERLARLTRRETEILQRMADGVPGRRIAEDLGISPNTLRTHIQNILFKLKVHSKVEALAAAIGYGKVRPRRASS
ncbi:MAG TPA: response regulator transcription factor [Actinomycetota bacterium]|nr:response regulator transcription factor [Actinomycetota bacterium]